MSDQFIREVDEELQRERLAALWSAFGPIVIAAAVVVVLGVSAKVGWDAWSQAARDADADRIAAARQALEQGDAEAAASAFSELAEDGSGDIPALAELAAAGALEQAGEEAGAIDALASAEEEASDPLLGELAALGRASRLIEREEFDAADEILEPIAAAGRPWRHSARELQAAILLARGENEQAREILAQLAEDALAPQSLRQRANALAESLDGTEP